MAQGKFVQPSSCEVDRKYYFKINGRNTGAIYREVRFLSYRPHPAEVLVHDGERPRVIHRSLLYMKAADCAECLETDASKFVGQG